jgi:hypothetical protein
MFKNIGRGITERDCRFFVLKEGSSAICKMNRKNCALCFNKTPRIEGLNYGEHVILVKNRFRFALTLIISTIALIVSLISLLVSVKVI